MESTKSFQFATNLGKTVAESIYPRASDANRDGILPKADVDALTSSGYSTLSVPKEYGGHGLPLIDCLVAQLELAQGNPSTALVAGMQIQVFGNAREQLAWETGKLEQFSHDAVKNGALVNSIATEPAMGSPSRGKFFKSTAELTPDRTHYLINGRKTWSTGGEHLTHLIVKLNLPEDDTGAIYIPNHTAGVRWEHTWGDVLSLRASDSHDVYFEDVRVPVANLVARDSLKKEGSNIWFPMVMSSIYLGAAIAARNTVIKYALERVPTALGKPIATLPKIQRQVGEIDVQLQAAKALFFKTAGDWHATPEQRAVYAPRIAATKHMVTETARSVTDKALQIAGGISLTNALPLERYFRDVRAGSMQPPSGDAALELVGRNAIEEMKKE